MLSWLLLQILEGASIADTHAALELIQEGAVLTDLGSATGTFFNGVRMTQPQRVVHGDLIKFGDAGREYKFDMTSTPSVMRSIASSFRDSLVPPMFSSSLVGGVAASLQKAQSPLRKSNVFASYQDQRSTDTTLRDIVERQLLRRSGANIKAIPTKVVAAAATVLPLSPSQRDFVERQKLRLSQKIRDVNNIMLGYAAIDDTYLAYYTKNNREYVP
ncbi:hypothetical protein DYB34_012965 [Aphanomyces astaci]|uniref:FHA domain-containing protein n=1 Tax=Aphanomyces astaci TaxID=112090 RepID=A0A3R6Z990_APHAT|nr:hypothetical protein DYB34_012965 [Aphanomyces astaci]